MTVTFNSTLASPSIPTPSEDEDRRTRPVDVEALLSVGELTDLEAATPFRFMFAKEEDVKDGLCERLELMQGAIMQGRAYQQMTERMKKEAALHADVKPKAEDDSKSPPTAMTDALPP